MHKHTISDVAAMWALYKGIEYIVRHDIPGDIVECGVWNGGSILLAAYALLHFGDRSRNLSLFDTFEGMPKPDAVDVDVNGAPALVAWQSFQDRGRLFGFGGTLIIDDYGYFQGSRKATDEYFAEKNLPLFLMRVNNTVHLAIKR